ncbi:hypothetical protein VZT92_022649 [Zoarces viviparus]|uniref:Uncharacterized protein n=1 Tax=Zoarces viviparus TaxID=48416 RepID=A0AAW1EBJ9_ZOAVI
MADMKQELQNNALEEASVHPTREKCEEEGWEHLDPEPRRRNSADDHGETPCCARDERSAYIASANEGMGCR